MNNTTMIKCLIGTLVIATVMLGYIAGYPIIGAVMAVMVVLANLGPDERQ